MCLYRLWHCYGPSVNPGVLTFSTWNMYLIYKIKEALRLYSVSGSNTISARINSTTPLNTSDIVDVNSGVNAFNLKNVPATPTVMSVTDAACKCLYLCDILLLPTTQRR